MSAVFLPTHDRFLKTLDLGSSDLGLFVMVLDLRGIFSNVDGKQTKNKDRFTLLGLMLL